MSNAAIHAAFISAVYRVSLPPPNGDSGWWWYEVTICQDDGLRWVARVRHQISGMSAMADAGHFPIKRASSAAVLECARAVAAGTPHPPTSGRGRPKDPKVDLDSSVWVVTLDGLDGDGKPRLADVVIHKRPMQIGASEYRSEPCTADVRKKTEAGRSSWYSVPCNGMQPDDAGAAAVSACRSIRWG